MTHDPVFGQHPDPPAPAAQPKSAPDAVWEAVRQDYIAGMSAPEASHRHGVGLSTLRARAAREGWRRADQPWMPPGQRDPWDEGAELEERIGGDLDRVELRELTYIASRRMMRAVMRGQAAEALRWRRVRIAMEAEEAELAQWTEADAARSWNLQNEAASDRPDHPGDRDDQDDQDGISDPD